MNNIQKNNFSEGYSDKNYLNTGYPVISREYHTQLNEIREKVKQGHCSTLKDCLLLFEDLWDASPAYEIMFSHRFQKEMEKLSHKDPEQYKHVLKKMEQIQAKPLHYKPLSGDLHGARRVHVGDFVLIYEFKDDLIIFHDYKHHNQIYMDTID
ncbi:type II toxin-antitoxin system RelE family toxin [Methanobacterium petrolearium]|uniref:type II toxin-antitoxin system RelE family toxin n=1 Tax=Methanobacterium petrolearium TaxID=710190 RepID=UPI003081E74F|nr:YafQ family addiction module toxin component [Methanobacterium petrolearium]BDZ71090.1 hypothetical protein GCM10025861_16070 [Methanobacterium petrolearium]